MAKQHSGGRYRRSGLKLKHHLIDGLLQLLEHIIDWEEVKSITPADIRHGAKTSGLHFRISRIEQYSIRLTARGSGAAQTVHIVSSNPDMAIDKLRQLPEFNGQNSFFPPT